ncbi:MAG: PAS domain-containing sensor histidine kinase, partial [bacterium]
IKELIRQKQRENHLGAVKIVFGNRKSVISLNNPVIPAGSLKKYYKRLVEQGFQGAERSFSGPHHLIDSVVPVFSGKKEKHRIIGVILFSYYDPSGFLAKINRIKMVYENFVKRKSYKSPLKTTYLSVILVITLLILFAAIWGGVQLAKRITIPFQKLVEGTREVAGGNLDYEVEVEADDEIKILVDSFNHMTRDLRIGKADLEKAYQYLKEANTVLDERREYIEALLENVAAGVFSINNQGFISTINKSALQILGFQEEDLRGKPFESCFNSPNYSPLTNILQEAVESRTRRIQRPLMLNIKNNPITLLVSLTLLADPGGNPQGSVVVLEDLTQLIKAQKAAAWKEIARRIAHEIKNPLTPIKLSAQRLKKKFEEKAPDYPQVVSECTGVIIDEVEHLKNLVNEFSRFSRMPVVKRKPVDLNRIVSNTVNLYQDHPSGVNLMTDLDPELPALQLDSQQMKQVLVNLIDNAIAAFEKDKTIKVITEYDADLQSVIIKVIDRGRGITAEDKNKLFLPYFSTRKAGTGLGLSIIHKIVTDHQGYIRLEDNQPKGTKFIMEIPAGKNGSQ